MWAVFGQAGKCFRAGDKRSSGALAHPPPLALSPLRDRSVIYVWSRRMEDPDFIISLLSSIHSPSRWVFAGARSQRSSNARLTQMEIMRMIDGPTGI